MKRWFVVEMIGEKPYFPSAYNIEGPKQFNTREEAEAHAQERVNTNRGFDLLVCEMVSLVKKPHVAAQVNGLR